jgi:hypothetical protein
MSFIYSLSELLVQNLLLSWMNLQDLAYNTTWHARPQVQVERIMQRSLDWDEAISDLCIRCSTAACISRCNSAVITNCLLRPWSKL